MIINKLTLLFSKLQFFYENTMIIYLYFLIMTLGSILFFYPFILM